MTRIELAAEREPGLYAFGTRPLRRLTAQEEIDAPFEDRLRSVWPYLVKRAKRFAATLTDRERAHLDAEDLVNEIVIALLEKDAKWDHTRGRYVTFAERMTRNVFAVKIEQARVVDAPSNALGRLKRYRRFEADGTLCDSSVFTMRAIEAALGDAEGLSAEVEPVSESTVRREQDDAPTPVSDEVAQALRGLADPTHALILGKTFGLFGGDEQTAQEIAETLGGNPKTVRSLQGRAKTALRRRIEKLREGPAV